MTLEAEPVSPGEALSGKLSGKLGWQKMMMLPFYVLLDHCKL